MEGLKRAYEFQYEQLTMKQHNKNIDGCFLHAFNRFSKFSLSETSEDTRQRNYKQPQVWRMVGVFWSVCLEWRESHIPPNGNFEISILFSMIVMQHFLLLLFWYMSCSRLDYLYSTLPHIVIDPKQDMTLEEDANMSICHQAKTIHHNWHVLLGKNGIDMLEATIDDLAQAFI